MVKCINNTVREYSKFSSIDVKCKVCNKTFTKWSKLTRVNRKFIVKRSFLINVTRYSKYIICLCKNILGVCSDEPFFQTVHLLNSFKVDYNTVQDEGQRQ